MNTNSGQWVQQLKSLINDQINKIHTCVPGKIDSFDSSKCIATVTPTAKFRKPNGEYIDYPKVNDIPVVFLQYDGQKSTIASPIKEGDGCLIFFSEQELDTYENDGQEPTSNLKFDLSNAICVVGLFTSANEVIKDACDNEATIIDREKTRIMVKKKEINILVDKDSKDTEINVTDKSVEVKRGSTVLEIKDGTVTINTKNVVINGELNVSGKVTSADLETSVASFNSHIHLCTAPSTPSSFPFPEGTSAEEMLKAMEGIS